MPKSTELPESNGTDAEVERRGSWASRAAVFKRLHLMPLARRRVVTALVVVGVALGTSLLLAILLMLQAIGRPFSSLSATVAQLADLQVTPLVHGRLPEDTIRTVRAVPGVATATPVIGGLTIVHAGGDAVGALLLGTDCSLALLSAGIDCDELLGPGDTAAGPGPGLVLGSKIAADLGLAPGDAFGVQGGPADAAHVGRVADLPEELNDGAAVLGSVPDVQELLGEGPFLDSVLVQTTPSDVGAADALEAVVGPVAEARPPRTDLALFLSLTRGLLAFTGVLVLVGGVLIAVNSFTLSLDDRRQSLAVAEVLGSSPRRTIAGLTLEGALLGALGGLVAVVPGHLIGVWLTHTVGASILRGTGASLDTAWHWWVLPVGIVSGLLCGTAAAAVPAVRLVREGSLLAIREQAGILPVYEAPRWPLSGVALVPAAAALAWAFGNGKAGLAVGLASIGIGAVGALMFVFGITPVVLRLIARWSRVAGAAGRLTAADVSRDPIRMSAVVTTLSLGVMVVLTTMNVNSIASSTLATHVADEVGDRMYMLPRATAAQIDAHVHPASLDRVRALPEVGWVNPIRLAVLDWSTNGVNVTSTDTDAETRRRSVALRSADPEAVWRRVDAGEVVLTELFAQREGVAAGDSIVLPTIEGMHEFAVAAVGVPLFGVDNGIGDNVVTSDATASRYWAAPIETLLVGPAPGVDTAGMQAAVDASGASLGLAVLDGAALREEASASINRFLRPIQVMGILLLVIAGLAVTNFLVLSMLQRRRLRAVLRFVGFSAPVEWRTLVYEGLVMGALGAVLGAAGGVLLTWLSTVASPALLPTPIPWALMPANIAIAAGLAVGVAVIASLPPGVEAGNLDLMGAITDE